MLGICGFVNFVARKFADRQHPAKKKLQVTVGVDPDVVITRESQILVQVHAAVNETRNAESQIRSEASAATCG